MIDRSQIKTKSAKFPEANQPNTDAVTAMAKDIATTSAANA